MEESMSIRLGTTMVSLHQELPLRILVPQRTAEGRVCYTVQTRTFTLPLKRVEREAVYQRVGQSEGLD